MAGTGARGVHRREPGPARVAAPLAVLLATACAPSNGPLMQPGSDCLGCHDGTRAKRWSVAGTIYEGTAAAPGPSVQGATVQITDATGESFVRRTNEAGNFYTAEHVTFPLTVCVSRHGTTSCMTEPISFGSCNACHRPGGVISPQSHAPLFPIDPASKHAAIGCIECHASFSSPRPASFHCAACHLARDATLPAKHTVSTSNPAIVVADFYPTSDGCLRCHADAQVGLTSAHPSGFEGTPPHNGATCLVCHDAFRQDEPWGGDFTTDPRAWPIGSGHGCLHCHPSGPPAGG